MPFSPRLLSPRLLSPGTLVVPFLLVSAAPALAQADFAYGVGEGAATARLVVDLSVPGGPAGDAFAFSFDFDPDEVLSVEELLVAVSGGATPGGDSLGVTLGGTTGLGFEGDTGGFGAFVDDLRFPDEAANDPIPNSFWQFFTAPSLGEAFAAAGVGVSNVRLTDGLVAGLGRATFDPDTFATTAEVIPAAFPVPEPASAALLLAGGVAVLARRRRAAA